MVSVEEYFFEQGKSVVEFLGEDFGVSCSLRTQIAVSLYDPHLVVLALSMSTQPYFSRLVDSSFTNLAHYLAV